MHSIFKYRLKVNDVSAVVMPEGARVLSIAEQRGGLWLWALVDTEVAEAIYTFEVHGTGNPIERPEELVHGATIQMSDGFVWHVFRRVALAEQKQPLLSAGTESA